MVRLVPGIDQTRAPATTELRTASYDVHGTDPVLILRDAGTAAGYLRTRADVFVAGPFGIVCGSLDELQAGRGHRIAAGDRYEFHNAGELYATAAWSADCAQRARAHSSAGANVGWTVLRADRKVSVDETFSVAAWLSRATVTPTGLDVIPSSMTILPAVTDGTSIWLGSTGSLGAVEIATGSSKYRAWIRLRVDNARPETYAKFDPATNTLTTAIDAGAVYWPAIAIRTDPGLVWVDGVSIRLIDGTELVDTPARLAACLASALDVTQVAPFQTTAAGARTGARGTTTVTVADHRGRPTP